MVLLGHTVDDKKPVVLTPEARRQGTYLIGTTGTGKTTLLFNIAVQDMNDPGRPAVIVLDPHGDFIDDLLQCVPPDRQEDVILFAPGDGDQVDMPLGLNLLSCDRTSPLERRLVTSTVVDTLRKLFAYSWGPRMEDLLRHSVLTLMETPDTTLLDLMLLLVSEAHRAPLTANLKDPVLRQFWTRQFAAYGKRELVEVVGSSLNKIGRFLVDPVIRNIVCQPANAFDIGRVMDDGKILLVNLSKGALGEENSALLGAVLINLILIASLRRREKPREERRPVHLIVDEYQSFSTTSFATLQSEARKYGVDVVVAHQYRDQLDEINRGAALNVANFIVMRVSGLDATELALQFDNTPPEPEIEYQPKRVRSRIDAMYYERASVDVAVPGKPRMYSDMQTERANVLSGLSNHQGRARLIGEKGKLVEYEFVTQAPQGECSPDAVPTMREQSRKLGTDISEVEVAIEERIGGTLWLDEIPPGEPID